jgi:PAS domain S-box-containing protein/putative nucleotidyltransferase with HDIG domain
MNRNTVSPGSRSRNRQDKHSPSKNPGTPSETRPALLPRSLASGKSGVCYLDRDGRIVRLDPQAADILGLSLADIGEGRERKNIRDLHLFGEGFDIADVVRSGRARLDIAAERLPERGEKRLYQADIVPWLDREGTVIGTIVVFDDITQRVEAEQSLQDNRRKLEHATELASVYFWEVDIATRNLILNDAFYEFLGTTAEAEGGYRMAMSRYTKRFVHPEDLPMARRHGRWLKAHRGVEPIPDFEHRIIRADREVRHVLSRTKVVRDSGGRLVGHWGAFQDVTEHRRAEKKYRDLFENANEAIVVSQDGKIAFLNPAAARLVGYPIKHLLGKPVDLGIHPDDREKVRGAYRRRMRGEDIPRIDTLRLVPSDGSIRWVEANTVMIDWEGRPAFLNLVVDVTERKEAEEKLESTLRNLRKTISGTIQAIIQVVERRDPYTAGHQRRVADLARSIATEMELSYDMIDGIRTAAMMHDIGKISVPAEILSKPGSLGQFEFGLIKEHSKTGYEILKDVEFPWPIAEIVYQHHERLDGSGYPRGLKGSDQLLEARIIALADVIEAIASHRPYRPSLGIEVALDEIKSRKGILYDPAVVDAALRLFEAKGYTLVN